MEKEQLLYSIDDILENFEKKCVQIDNREKEGKKTLPGYTMVDLGLPSGTLWATTNAKGYYNYDLAVETFGDNLPSVMQMAELTNYCSWLWNSKKKGYDVTGPNGNSIFLPCIGLVSNYFGGNREAENTDYGYYWTRRKCKDYKDWLNSQGGAYYLYFGSGYVTPLNNADRAYGFAVRPVVGNKD